MACEHAAFSKSAFLISPSVDCNASDFVIAHTAQGFSISNNTKMADAAPAGEDRRGGFGRGRGTCCNLGRTRPNADGLHLGITF
jgi:hypothetical protein